MDEDTGLLAKKAYTHPQDKDEVRKLATSLDQVNIFTFTYGMKGGPSPGWRKRDAVMAVPEEKAREGEEQHSHLLWSVHHNTFHD